MGNARHSVGGVVLLGPSRDVRRSYGPSIAE